MLPSHSSALSSSAGGLASAKNSRKWTEMDSPQTPFNYANVTSVSKCRICRSQEDLLTRSCRNLSVLLAKQMQPCQAHAKLQINKHLFAILSHQILSPNHTKGKLFIAPNKFFFCDLQVTKISVKWNAYIVSFLKCKQTEEPLKQQWIRVVLQKRSLRQY